MNWKEEQMEDDEIMSELRRVKERLSLEGNHDWKKRMDAIYARFPGLPPFRVSTRKPMKPFSQAPLAACEEREEYRANGV
jgi:hypothetical protein